MGACSTPGHIHFARYSLVAFPFLEFLEESVRFFLVFSYLYYNRNNFCYKINIIQLCELLGDYDLKVMRQEYYIGRQKAV